MTNQRKILFGGIVGCLLLTVCALCGIIIGLLVRPNVTINNPVTGIDSYEECVAAGYPVLELFPSVCYLTDGRSFTDTSSTTPTPTPVPMPVPTPAPTGTTLEVKVYFSSDPESYEDPSYSVAVDRESNRTDIATYTIEELIEGPTAAEKLAGLFTPIELSGTSNCSGDDFTLDIDAETREATLQFCKIIASAGIGDDARVISTVNGTLTQFTTVDTVIILTKDGNCFGDESGMNTCLN